MILVIKNCAELSYIQDYRPELLSKRRVLTNFPEVWLLLANRGCSPAMAADFITENDYLVIKNRVRWLMYNWYLPVKGSLEYRGINLGELCRIDNWVFFYEVVTANMVMDKLLGEDAPGEIAVFDYPEVPCVGRSRYNGAHSILSAVAIKKAEEKGANVNRLRVPLPQQARPLRMAQTGLAMGRATLQRLRRKLSTASSRYHPGPLPSTLPERDTYSIITLAETYDAYIVWPVLSALATSGKFQGHIIGTGARTRARDRSGLDYDAEIPHVPIGRFLPGNGPVNREDWSRVVSCREGFVDSLSNHITALGAPLGNYLPGVQYNYWWNSYFPSAMRRIDAAYRILDELRPDAVIIEDMMSYPSRSLDQLARRRGIKSISMPHGCINDIEEYDFDSDVFLAWGELGKKQLLRHFQKPENSIEIAGSMVMEHVGRTLARGDETGAPRESKSGLGLRSDSRVILIITVCFSWQLYGPLDMGEYLAAWNEIKEYASRHPEIDFVIKASPTEDYRSWYELLRASAGENMRIISDIQIETILPFVDEVILFQVISTAGIVAMLAGKPLLFFDNAIRPWHNHPQKDWNEENGLTTVSRSADIPACLDRLNSDAGFRKDVIEGEKRFLDSYLYRGDEGTANRIVSVFEKALSGHPDYGRTGRS